MGEKRCPIVLPGMGRATCPTLGKIKGKRKQRESTPKLKCFLCDGPHLTRECLKRKALSTFIEKSEKTMEDARLGLI